MSFLSRYAHDIYVCFAAADNQSGAPAQDGWVTKLAKCLDKELALQAKVQFGIFIDEAHTEDKPLDDEARRRMRDAAVLVVVLSSSYCASAPCLQELEEFLDTIKDRVRHDSRIFLVEREKIAREERPPKLYDVRGSRFWTEDEERGSRTLSSRTDDGLLYWQELNRFSAKVFGELQRIKSAEDRAAGKGGEAELDAAPGAAFDVFLCHNSKDKDAVKQVGQQLKKLSIKPWLDEWEFQPGHPWQDELTKQIRTIKSAAIFVGDKGIGPWQNQEISAFIRNFVKRNCPVIPVIFEGVDAPPKLPPFLEGMMWVDFRQQEPDPMEQLVWGITDEKPDWRPTVFLAEVTDDLYWVRAEVAQYLDQAGLRVLPDTALYPEDPFEFHAALDRDLSRSRLFVQLLSKRSGRETIGMPPDFVHAQFDHAKTMGKRIMQWRSPDLTLDAVADADHARFLTNEHVLAERLQEFKKRVEQKARDPDNAPASALPRVHVHRTSNDLTNTEGIERINGLLEEQKIARYPAAGDDLDWLNWVFTHLDGMLIVYNHDYLHSVRKLLREWLDRQFEHEWPPELAVCKCPPPNGGEAIDCWGVPGVHLIDNSDDFDANKLQSFIDAVRITATRAKV